VPVNLKTRFKEHRVFLRRRTSSALQQFRSSARRELALFTAIETFMGARATKLERKGNPLMKSRLRSISGAVCLHLLWS
jgi:hypothetical protein